MWTEQLYAAAARMPPRFDLHAACLGKRSACSPRAAAREDDVARGDILQRVPRAGKETSRRAEKEEENYRDKIAQRAAIIIASIIVIIIMHWA